MPIKMIENNPIKKPSLPETIGPSVRRYNAMHSASKTLYAATEPQADIKESHQLYDQIIDACARPIAQQTSRRERRKALDDALTIISQNYVYFPIWTERSYTKDILIRAIEIIESSSEKKPQP